MACVNIIGQYTCNKHSGVVGNLVCEPNSCLRRQVRIIEDHKVLTEKLFPVRKPVLLFSIPLMIIVKEQLIASINMIILIIPESL